MEGSASEAVFSSLNLNPQIFVNETLNTVDDLLDDAFEFYYEEASGILKTEGSERSQHLKEAIDSIRYMVQPELDKRLAMWEKYCLHHCFAVPEGFSLPKTAESPNHFTIQDLLCHPALDSQLDSLRERLSVVSRESIKLNRELQDLESKYAATDRCNKLVAEVFQSYDKNSADSLLQEMLQTAAEFRQKIENPTFPGPEDTESSNLLLPSNNENGLCNAKLEQLQEFLGQLKNQQNNVPS